MSAPEGPKQNSQTAPPTRHSATAWLFRPRRVSVYVAIFGVVNLWFGALIAAGIGGFVMSTSQTMIQTPSIVTLWDLFGRLALITVAACSIGVVIVAASWSRLMLRLRPSLGSPTPLRAERGNRPRKAYDGRSALAIPYNDYQRGLLGTSKAEREFIANIGHELRTPITLVLTSCELLKESQNLQAPDRRSIDRISNAAEHMSELVRTFLMLARDGEFGAPELIPLRQCVLDSFAPHWVLIKERGLAVRIEVPPDASLHANREALFVVIGNLVRNAVNYTERGGITVQYTGKALFVTDTGCGIDEGDLQKIFTPFFRSKGVAESGRTGLGLGLSIVRRISDFYGWPIEFRSTVNVGTTVKLMFERQ